MPDTPGRPIARALISVSDKTGLAAFAATLAGHGVAILSTGGTASTLRDAGIAVTDVSDHTGFPEIMDGRVKTLHPAIHGGILARRDDAGHRAALEEHGIAGIDLVVVNLYPFEEAVREGAALDTCIETIDIGGPAMIRAAAKNHDDVTVVVQPADYQAVLAEMAELGGATSPVLRRRLAATAFARTAAYDAAIARRLGAESEDGLLPDRMVFGGARSRLLRYGENPHQSAALYVDPAAPPGVAQAALIQGKEPSYNNLADAEAAHALVREFGPPAIAIIKHGNPCGVGLGDTLAGAYGKARACDPVSAFGGVVAANRTLDGATARAIAGLFTEVVIAPDADEDARALLAAKSDLRVLLTGAGAGAGTDDDGRGLMVRTLGDGFLVQTTDTAQVDPSALRTVTRRAPTEQERADLLFAFTVAKHVKSNAIVLAKGGATVGIGAGQMSRVDSSRIAAQKAADAAAAAGEERSRAEGCVVASDAFFPFADGLLAAAAAGATAVIQPGGSKRDAEVIAAADEQGLAMVFTGLRHFRH